MSRMLARKPVAKYRLDYSLSNLPDTATWVAVIAATTQPCSAMEIFNASAATLKISTGAAGLENAGELPYYVLPGGSSILLPIEVAKGGRISVKAVDQTPVSVGTLVLNLFG